MKRVTVVGAGLAGLSAAIELAKHNIECILISQQPSERAQSVLAEGGFNAALDLMGEGDSVEEHRDDTLKSGGYLADPKAVAALTEAAPGIFYMLRGLGVPFQTENGRLIQRSFGGQRKRRTAYVKSGTGKAIMTALIDEARKYETAGLIRRYPHHEFKRLILSGDICEGVLIRDMRTDEALVCPAPVLLAFGGLNGLFPGMTTGTTLNTANAAAGIFTQGVAFSNLEMIQYHPTTIGVRAKRILVSEAARGEGGRLFALRDGKPWYFMEDKYPELGNLMPRDVISGEMDLIGGQVYLDMTALSTGIWENRLPDLRAELIYYLGLDPAVAPIPVSCGIHFFMGGIEVDRDHRTSVKGLWAAGECACQYHGANRLGGNSMLSAVYGGMHAAEQMAAVAADVEEPYVAGIEMETAESPVFAKELSDILLSGLGIHRDREGLDAAMGALRAKSTDMLNETDKQRLALGMAMLQCAYERKESRGAHNRTDYPERDDVHFRRTTSVVCDKSGIQVSFKELPEADNI